VALVNGDGKWQGGRGNGKWEIRLGAMSQVLACHLDVSVVLTLTGRHVKNNSVPSIAEGGPKINHSIL